MLLKLSPVAARLIQRLRSQQRRGKSARDGILGSYIPLAVDTRQRIEVLARELGVDPPTFSRQLLDRALAEALSCLDPQAHERANAELHAQLVNELEAERERVRFEGGAP